MIEALDKNEMPPEDEKQPSETQRQSLLIHLNKSLNRSLVSNPKLIPFKMRRMNRFEYGNAVRDLFDLDCWVYSISDRIIRDHNHYFRPETGKMPDVVRVGNRIMGSAANAGEPFAGRDGLSQRSPRRKRVQQSWRSSEHVSRAHEIFLGAQPVGCECREFRQELPNLERSFSRPNQEANGHRNSVPLQ